MTLVEPWQAAALTARPVATIRDWAKRGLVTAACDVATRRLVVCPAEVAERAEQAGARHAARRFRRVA